MTISNSCKKMMAFVMALALVLSVLFIPSPKTAKAGENDPSVTVLGATIRLGANDNNGTQSMRIGIRVDNANKAKACAIQLTVGATTFTVATSADKGDLVQDKLHSKDAENNSIVYAVVLTNIPQDSFYANIGILGKAWNMNDEVFTSAEVNKNVMGVVSTLQSKFPELHIRMDNGVLYKNNSTTEALTADDFSGNYTNDPDPETTSNPVVTPTPAPAENTYVVDFNNPGVVTMPETVSLEGYSAVFNSVGSGKDLVIDLPAAEVLKRYQTITIKYAISSGSFGFKYHKQGAAADSFVFDPSTHQFDAAATSREITVGNSNSPIDQLILFDWNSTGKMVVDSIIFSNPKPDYSGDVDLSQTTVDGVAIDQSTVASLDSGVITVNDSEGSTELLFPLPNGGTIDSGEAVSVVVEGTVTVPEFVGFRVRLAEGSSGGTVESWSSNFTSTQSREFKEVFNFTTNSANTRVVSIKSTSSNGNPISGLTISKVSVYWTGRGATAPTAMPSPTPLPTATPVPTAVPSAKTYAVQVPSGSSITVDGNVDAAWSNAIEYPFLYYSNGRARNSSEATIKLLWDEDYIYGLYDVYDAYIDQENSDEWNRDGIEIFFDEDNSKESAYGGGSDPNTDAFQYRVSGLASDVTSPAKNGFSHNTSATSELYAGLTSNVKTASNGCGYRVEFAIPVAQKNNLGRVVGLDATVMDSQSGTRNNEMWFTSQKSGSMYSDASLFENVQLIATKPATPVNSPNPADPADCLAHFTFDNSSRDGYVYKSTDGNAKATVIGSIDSVSTEAISGESLYKAKGNPSYLKLQNADGSSILDGKDNITISYWSYVPDAYDSNAVNYGWAFYAGRNGISLGTNNRYYLALIDRDSKYRIDMAKSGGGGNNVDNIAKTSGSWNNVTVVVKDNGDDTATSTVYVNGVQQATINGLTLGEALGTNSKFLIGIRPWASGDGAEYFQGYIDDFAVFGRAFTSTEVANYVGAVSVPTPAPTATPAPTPTATPPVTDTELDAANLVPNGNFANGKTGWDQNGGSTSAVVVDYTNCLMNSGRWNSFSGPRTHLTGSFNVGDVLTYQFKIKRQSSLAGLSGSDNYFIIKFSETGTEHTSRPTSNSDGTTNAVCDNEHWTTIYGTYTVQETTDSITVVVMENNYIAYGDSNPSSNYSFYIDDVQIVRTYAAPTPSPTPVPTATPAAAVWNDNYETQAKYELWTPSGTADTGMLGKEVIFVALADNDKVYAMSANGDAITKTDISDMYFGDTLYIPTNYNLYNISWSTMWNKANSTTTPDMGTGYLFQNMEDETYLGIWGVEVSSQGLPTGMTSNQIDYKRRFTWSSTLYANYKNTNFLHFDGTDFDADTTAGTNVLCYVKSYTGDNAVKNTWHQVDHFTTGRDYLLVTSNTPGTAKALYMNGTANNSYDGKEVTINNDGTITYDGAYNDSAVVNAHSMNDGTFYLDIWAYLSSRHTLSYNGNGSDQSLYITSDNSLSTYAFRFEYSSGALKAYYGSSGKDTVMPVRWRTRSSGALGVGNGSSNTNEFYIFERDITPQDYTPPVPTGREYQKITDVSQIQDGDKIVMIFDGKATGTDFGPEIMIPEGVEINNRIGFNVVSTDVALNSSIYGDSYEAYEWTFTKSGDKWLVGTAAGNVKFESVSGKGVTATLVSEGDELTVSGSSVYTFYNDNSHCFNRNTTRALINAYAGEAAHFYLYRYVD